MLADPAYCLSRRELEGVDVLSPVVHDLFFSPFYLQIWMPDKCQFVFDRWPFHSFGIQCKVFLLECVRPINSLCFSKFFLVVTLYS